MREIKFRAWSLGKEHGMRVFNLGDIDGGGLLFPDSTWIDIEDCTTEQFTGLRDKNCHEIYEGDIIECALMFQGTSLPHMGEVVFDNEHAGWATKNEAGLTLFIHHELIAGRKIIGNIHENPELIK